MNKQTSYKILRMVHSLNKVKNQISESIARDLYDLVEEETTDKTLKEQMRLARVAKYTRQQAVKYINHRLNIGL